MNAEPSAIGKLPAKDVFSEIYDSMWYKHHAGAGENAFDYIHAVIRFDITETRNIHFKYSDEDNYHRKQRPCKITTQNMQGIIIGIFVQTDSTPQVHFCSLSKTFLCCIRKHVGHMQK